MTAFDRKAEEIRIRTEQEVLDRIEAEEKEKAERKKAMKDAEEAAEEAKHVAEMKEEAEEQRKITKAEAKKEAMRLAIRRQADEILAKNEYKEKISAAAHKYNLMQVGRRVQ